MTNVRCKGGKEIDLLALDPKTGVRYHIEVTVLTSKSFALREKDTFTSTGKVHKRGLDYFHKEKFEHQAIQEKIREFFGNHYHHRVLLVWHAQDRFIGFLTKIAKKKYDIELLSFQTIIHVLSQRKYSIGSRDDIMRTMELIATMRHYKEARAKRHARKLREWKEYIERARNDAKR
jgi:hypothetical protein